MAAETRYKVNSKTPTSFQILVLRSEHWISNLQHVLFMFVSVCPRLGVDVWSCCCANLNSHLAVPTVGKCSNRRIDHQLHRHGSTTMDLQLPRSLVEILVPKWNNGQQCYSGFVESSYSVWVARTDDYFGQGANSKSYHLEIFHILCCRKIQIKQYFQLHATQSLHLTPAKQESIVLLELLLLLNWM